MRRKIVFLTVIFLLGVALSWARGWLPSGGGSFQRELNLFVNAVRLVRSDYVEEVPFKRIFSGAMDGMLKSLDPYSQYLDEEAYKELRVKTDGAFGGIGVEVGIKEGLLRIITALEDSPAEAAGLKPGDTIVRIDDHSTRGLSLSDAAKKMRGAAGTRVRLSIMREEEGRVFDVTLDRKIILVKSISDARLLENKIGYIKISSFQQKTAEDFEKALQTLEAQSLSALVIDVRNNPGGILSSAVRIAEKFIPKGEVIVSTRGRNPQKNKIFRSQCRRLRRLRLAILVNKGSASGSEILAGAVQDHGLGKVIGSKTFGKASVQTLTPLSDGTAIRMTTSKYYTPEGRLLHEVGVTPDIILSDEKIPDAAIQRAVKWIKEE